MSVATFVSLLLALATADDSSPPTRAEPVPDDARDRVHSKAGARHWLVRALLDLGLERARDPHRSEFLVSHSAKALEWSALSRWQRPNHVPGELELRDKSRVLSRLTSAAPAGALFPTFVPETYLLANQSHRAAFRERARDAATYPWVVKDPTRDPRRHMGSGVVLVATPADLGRVWRDDQDGDAEADEADAAAAWSSIREERLARRSNSLIAQRYVRDLLLYDGGRKFDLRVYLLVASVDPLVVLYHDGTLRVSLATFDEKNLKDRKMHLTNHKVQMEDRAPVISAEDRAAARQLADSTRVDFATFDAFLRRRYTGDPLGLVRCRMKTYLATIARAVAPVLARRTPGVVDNAFSFMGADFMVDQNLDLHFTEIQPDPGMKGDTTAIQRLKDRMGPDYARIIYHIHGTGVLGGARNETSTTPNDSSHQSPPPKNPDSSSSLLPLPARSFELLIAPGFFFDGTQCAALCASSRTSSNHETVCGV